jgi:hypothetical protein
MFKSTKTKVIALALVGVVALGGAIYTTTALAAGGATASPATSATTQTTVDQQLRASVLEMLKDRMGLTGANAEQFADQMIARMQSANPNLGLKSMINWCNQFIGQDTNGATYGGRNMMGGATNPNAVQNGGYCNPSGTGPQAGGQTSGSSYGPRGAAGGNGYGMMGSSGR